MFQNKAWVKDVKDEGFFKAEILVNSLNLYFNGLRTRDRFLI